MYVREIVMGIKTKEVFRSGFSHLAIICANYSKIFILMMKRIFLLSTDKDFEISL